MTDPLDNLERILRLQARDNGNRPEDYYLLGSRRQRETQKQLLQQVGLRIVYHQNHPGLSDRHEYLEALRLLWRERPDGWWLYRQHLLTENICTDAEFEHEHQRQLNSAPQSWLKKLLG